MPDVWLINGIPGSGKTTTARTLASRFARGVHIKGDRLQDFIVTGSVPPGGNPPQEEERQIHSMCAISAYWPVHLHKKSSHL